MPIAIITGASSGIGESFVQELDSTGLSEIWLISRNEERLNALSNRLKSKSKIIIADLSTNVGIQKVITIIAQEKPNIQYLINNAGFGKVGRFHSISDGNTTGMITLQVQALTQITHASIPFMLSGSSILLVSSLASFVSIGGFATYSAVKSYITNLGMSLYFELKERNIHVCTVCPGPVKSRFWEVSKMNAQSVGKDVLPVDITRKALEDCKKRKPQSIYGLGNRFVPLIVRIFGTRLIASLTWKFMKREMRKQNLDTP